MPCACGAQMREMTRMKGRTTNDEDKSLLSGLKVLDLSSNVAGPYCAKLLGSMGAEVIKVEAPDRGDESRHAGPFPNDIPDSEKSALFLYLNTSKKSVTLNLETATGQTILRRLAAQTEVIVESFDPDTLSSLGLDHSTLEKDNPGLVMTSVTSFGQTGPYRNFKAKQINQYAYGGLMYITGRAEREPLQMGPKLPEYGAGQNAFVATLSAIWHKELTGEGQRIDISIAEYSASILENALSMYSYTRHKVNRTGNRGYGRAAWGIYPCKDGYVGVIAGPEHRWSAMAELMDEPALAQPEFADRRVRQERADELEALMTRWLSSNNKREIFERAQALGLAFAYVAGTQDILSWEHLRERGYFVTLEHPAVGELDYPGAPFQPGGAPLNWTRAPMLGEHNKEIYCERLGYSEEELLRLKASRVI